MSRRTAGGTEYVINHLGERVHFPRAGGSWWNWHFNKGIIRPHEGMQLTRKQLRAISWRRVF